MTPEELRALADAATPTEDELNSWSRAVDTPGEGWERREPVDQLVQLAPDLARLCADYADELAALAHCSTAVKPLLAKLAELESR
jgi:hypothetical protein